MTGENPQKDEDSEHQLQSGPWSGHFQDPRSFGPHHPAGHKWPIDVIMDIKHRGEKFWAFGMDEIGTFILKRGTIKGGRVSFTKAYRTHRVNYHGHVQNGHIMGYWRFPGDPEDTGTFSMEAVPR